MNGNLKLYRELMHVSHFLRHGHGRMPAKPGKRAGRMAPGQHRVLTTLGNAGPMTQRDMTAELGISPAALSELLTKLEEQGLVARERAQEDRRITLVTLTPSGKKQAKAMLDAEQRSADEVFGSLSKADRDQLDRILGEIIESWEQD